MKPIPSPTLDSNDPPVVLGMKVKTKFSLSNPYGVFIPKGSIGFVFDRAVVYSPDIGWHWRCRAQFFSGHAYPFILDKNGNSPAFDYV